MMKEVSKADFYKRINPLDVVGHVTPRGDKVYEHNLKMRNGMLVGMVVTDHKTYPATKTYYLYT